MVAVKAHQATSFLAKPDPNVQAYLFFGTDPGLIGERSKLLAEKLADTSTPASEILRLDDKDLEAEPDRISIEVQTLPMFGGGKVLRISHSRRVTPNTVAPVLDVLTPACRIIIEAGNLKPIDPLRKLFEKSRSAAAVACYSDSARDLESLINQKLSESQQTISMDGREILVARLGADRALSLGELEKLTLYTHGQRQITADDVDAIVGDASELAIDKIVYAAASGKAQAAILECGRALASGESVQGILLAMQRHFLRLEATRSHIDTGNSEADALRRLKPPLHFKLKDAFAAQIHMWHHRALLDALAAINTASKETRTTGALDKVLVERLLIRLAQMAQKSRRSARHPT